jgi:DNA-binding transcriptional regulator/RsmH inhibitor MraZ
MQFEYSANYNDETGRSTLVVYETQTGFCEYVDFPCELADALGEQAFAAYLVSECDHLAESIASYAREEIEREARRAEAMGNADEIARLIEETFAGRWNADLNVRVTVRVDNAAATKDFAI